MSDANHTDIGRWVTCIVHRLRILLLPFVFILRKEERHESDTHHTVTRTKPLDMIEYRRVQLNLEKENQSERIAESTECLVNDQR